MFSEFSVGLRENYHAVWVLGFKFEGSGDPPCPWPHFLQIYCPYIAGQYSSLGRVEGVKMQMETEAFEL